jgi:hypothetical protein
VIVNCMNYLGTPAFPALLAFSAGPLVHLRVLDIVVIAIYFCMVIWIGFYLKGISNTSEEFFMAGREMTAWIAGLSFVDLFGADAAKGPIQERPALLACARNQTHDRIPMDSSHALCAANGVTFDHRGKDCQFLVQR